MSGPDSGVRAAYIGGAITVVIAVIGWFAAPVIANWVNSIGKNSGAAVEPGSSGTSAVTESQQKTSVPEVGTGCATRDGKKVSCDSDGSGLISPAAACTPGDFLNSRGVDTTLQFRLKATTANRECIIYSAGATGNDIAGLSATGVPSVLLQCATQPDGSGFVACAVPHRIEFTTAWADRAVRSDATAQCQDRARTYSGQTLDSDALNAVALESGSKYRCAIRSLVPLTGTVWHLNGKPLPAAS
ncbi:hypothetical protein [Flexivirga meconopsidis]|uniref:hypothetical protein n=1 Tax=Flexivirga meconopsidis TaxID=2977121 RepID=UPI0022402F86|nr:hypothetical protein [Flexivirga meconopsidis]